MKKLLLKILNQYTENVPAEDLIDHICKDQNARFSQQYVNGNRRFWFEYKEGKTDVTAGAESTMEEAIAAFIISKISSH